MYKTCWIIFRFVEHGINHDFETSWDELFSYKAKPLAWNWDKFPINVLFSTFVDATPVLVMLPWARDGPVLLLALFRAVSPLLAPSTYFDRRAADFKTEGTVSDRIIILEKKKNIIIENICVRKSECYCLCIPLALGANC